MTDRAQQRLSPDWRQHAFLTDLDGTAVEVDRFHRHHAVVDLAIRDLKQGTGLEHVPHGNFHANSIRWTATLGKVLIDDRPIVARTIRTRLLTIPGRLVNRAPGQHCDSQPGGSRPSSSPTALNTLRTVQPATG